MNAIGIAKIEACLELCSGTTPNRKALDFKQKVFTVTALTEQGFERLGCTDVAFKMLKEGKPIKEILDACF
ncbi:hypothetical protein PSPHG_CDS_0132 [Pseudomonas phage Psxphi15]